MTLEQRIIARARLLLADKDAYAESIIDSVIDDILLNNIKEDLATRIRCLMRSNPAIREKITNAYNS